MYKEYGGMGGEGLGKFASTMSAPGWLRPCPAKPRRTNYKNVQISHMCQPLDSEKTTKCMTLK